MAYFRTKSYRDMPPRETERFCFCCKKNTKFKYDNVIGHSVCKDCGCRMIDIGIAKHDQKVRISRGL